MNEAGRLRDEWAFGGRWNGVQRNYAPEQVLRLRGTVLVEHTLARLGAEKFWHMLNTEPYIKALGAYTGLMAVAMVAAGQKAIYMSGWQVAADANSDLETYPDMSLYSVRSVPDVVQRINNAFKREDEKQRLKNREQRDWFAPIVADGESGGGKDHTFELMKKMIRAGASAVHFEDQLGSEKKCGHLGGKVLVSTSQFIWTLSSAREAADVLGVPTVIIARTDAHGAYLVNNDIDDRDKPFLTGERTPEGFYRMRGGMDCAIARSLAYAPYADLLWYETSNPDLAEARQFAEAIHKEFPGKLLAYNLSPSFNWTKLPQEAVANFQDELGKLGYKFQFVTLAGVHALMLATFKLAQDFAKRGMPAYVDLQTEEFAKEKDGYPGVKHQELVGTGYFDEVAQTASGGETSTSAMDGSTEKDQFK
ncbi:MAG: isocitrate lyase [bacterium]|nr:isocitrate lyase [bacterium]